MPVTPAAAPATRAGEDLVRAGRITAALDLLLADSQPSVDTLTLVLECRLARGEMDLAARNGTLLAGIRNPSAAEAAQVSLALAELAAATERDDEAVE
ncbi:MAG: hypothetical protein ACRDO4_18700, partial [Nocardioides sp.]